MRLSTVWSRISSSKATLLYFSFAVLHFAIQLALQVYAYTLNSKADALLSNVVAQTGLWQNGSPYLQGNTLRVCETVQVSYGLKVDANSCRVIWGQGEGVLGEQTRGNDTSYDTLSPSRTTIQLRPTTTSTVFVVVTGPTPTPITAGQLERLLEEQEEKEEQEEEEDDDDDDDDDDYKGVQPVQRYRRQDAGSLSTVVNLHGESYNLSKTCVWSLSWPLSLLHDTERQDIVFITFQFWVLGMSMVALFYESIPHACAALLTHGASTAWAINQLDQTARFRDGFGRVVMSACNNAPLLPTYWVKRQNSEIASLVFNVVALIASSFLTWKLLKTFGWQTFKRVGASMLVNHIYKLVLTLSICLQLSLFFIMVAVALWIDRLVNSVIGDFARMQTLYKATSITTLVLLVPWLTTGWIAVKRELNVPMFVFLFLALLYIAGWGVMFFSTTFRFTFVTWPFFAVMASASFFLTCLAAILGVVCCYNFDKGLAKYLNHQREIPDDPQSYGDDKDVEKVMFPGGYRDDFRSSGSTMSGTSQRTVVQHPEPVVYWIGSQRSNSTNSKNSLTSTAESARDRHMRSDSRGSGKSSESQKKRWVIE